MPTVRTKISLQIFTLKKVWIMLFLTGEKKQNAKSPAVQKSTKVGSR